VYILKKSKKILLSVLFIIIGATVVSGDVIHVYNNGFYIARGVYYQLNRRVTNAGIVDVHVLVVDLTYPGITLGPVMPNHGSRNTTTNLLRDGGAIGGINADFFNMGVYPGTPFGTVIQNGQILEMYRGRDDFATFLIDVHNTPLIEYIQPDIVFLNNGIRNLTIQAINKIEGAISATVFDRNAIYNTTGIDARQSGLVKIVVENDVITHISEPGEVVDVPYGGYIIALSQSYATYFTESILVGHTAELFVDASVDIDAIWQAIGGAGTILQDGQLSTSGYVVAPNSRHPRSAVGFSEDESTVFLVAVDGRGRSAGATHAEMATIMQDIGAYRAMHLDGGGSTTLGLREPGQENMRVINTVSDGSQRRVVNALGVFNNSIAGILSDIEIRTFPNRVFVGDVLDVNPVGLDGHLNTLELASDMVLLATESPVSRDGNMFFPTVPAPIDFNLTYGNFNTTASIEVLELAQIVPNVQTLDLNTGETATLTFTGLSPLGHSEQLNSVFIEATPADVGSFYNNVFTAGTSSGVIRASIGDIATYIGVSVNEQGHIDHPESDVSQNPYNVLLEPEDPGFDITIAGNTSLAPFLELPEIGDFVQMRNRALHTFMRGSNLGVFVGPTEITEMENLDTMAWSISYRLDNIGNGIGMVSLNATNGSLTNTSVYNWRFISEVNYYDIDHVIVLINTQVDTLPVYEQQMLLHALEQMVLERSVFVVSAVGTESTATIENGVNFINLGSLFDGDDINDNFQILRLRIYQGNINFDMQNAF